MKALTYIGKGRFERTDKVKPVVVEPTDAVVRVTLSSICTSMPYYRHILPYGEKKFARYALNVWHIDAHGKNDRQIAIEGLDAMERWMKGLGLITNLKDLGADESMIEGIVKSTLVMDGGYKVLDTDEIRSILKASL